MYHIIAANLQIRTIKFARRYMLASRTSFLCCAGELAVARELEQIWKGHTSGFKSPSLEISCFLPKALCTDKNRPRYLLPMSIIINKYLNSI